MTREEKVKNLLSELIDMIDNGSQRDLDRADEISKTIIEALSQEPSRRKGHWTNNQNGTYECDKCGCKHSRSKYCPKCGARMDKSNAENTLESALKKRCEKSHEMIEDRLNCSCGIHWIITGHWDKYNYCPNCGEKTESEDKE